MKNTKINKFIKDFNNMKNSCVEILIEMDSMGFKDACYTANTVKDVIRAFQRIEKDLEKVVEKEEVQ